MIGGEDMETDDIERCSIGSLVQTPTGRIGVISAWTYGKRGDLPRCPCALFGLS